MATSQNDLVSRVEASDTTRHGTEATSWYAIRTRHRHEKKATEELRRRAIDTYLPLYGSVREWKNGRHLIQMPLFPGYAFVRIVSRERLEVLRVPGVVDLVGSNGKPLPVAEIEITSLRQALAQAKCAGPHPFITRGRKVRITAGPLSGLQGIVVRRKGRIQVVVSVELIRRSVLIETDLMELDGLL